MSIQFTARYSVVLLLGLAAACSRKNANNMDTSSAAGAIAPDTNPPAAAAPMTSLPPGIVITVASKTGTGLFLADGSGRALYILDKTPSDTNNWKPVSGASAPTTTDTSIKSSMIGTTSGANGMQATYGGKALYYYAGDSAAGDVKGEGKKESGATGHILHPDGSMAGGKHNRKM